MKFRRLLKYLFSLSLLLLGGVLAFAFFFALYFEHRLPARVKEHFSQASEQVLQDFRTGVALSRHFPFFALRIRDFVVVDTTGGRVQPVLQVEKADLHLHPAALFRGRLGIRRTTVSGLTFSQTVDSLGRRISFKFKKAAASPGASAPSAAFEISGLEIRRARIVLQNHFKGTATTLQVERAQLAVQLANDTLALEGSLSGRGHQANRKRVLFNDEPFTAQVQYAYALSTQTGRFTNTTLQLNELPIRLSGTHAKLPDQPGSDLNLLLEGEQPLREVLHDLVPDTLQSFFAQAEGSGLLAFSYAITGPSGPTVKPRSRIGFSLREGGLRWPQRQAALTDIALAGELDTGEESGPASSTLALSQLSAVTGTGGFSGSLRVHNFLQPNVSGRLTCDSGLRELAGVLDLPNAETYRGQLLLHIQAEDPSPADKSTSRPLAWQGRLAVKGGAFQPGNTTVLCSDLEAEAEFAGQAVQVKRLAGKIDGHAFTLQASARNFMAYLFGTASTLHVEGVAQAKLLDLAWLAERKESKSGGGGLGQSKLFASASGTLALHLQQVRLTPQDDVKDLRVNFRKHREKIDLTSIRFQTPMNGAATGNGGLRLVGGKMKAPFLNMDLRFGQLDLQHLMQLIATLGATTQKIAGEKVGAPASQASALEAFRVRMRVIADKLSYESLSATDLQLLASLTEEKAEIEQFDMRTFGGRFASSGTMDLTAKEGYPVQLNAQIERMDLYRMFYVADQLGLDLLRSQNIRGNIDCALLIRTRLNDAFLPSVPTTTAFARAVIRDLELIEVEPIQKALHFLREKRTRHIHFEDVHTEFALHQNRFITPGINLTNNISYFHLTGSYTMEERSDLYVEVSLLDVLFGNNDRRIRRIKDDPTPTQGKQLKQHLFLHRNQGKYQVKLAQRKDNDEAKERLQEEFRRLLAENNLDPSLHQMPGERNKKEQASVRQPDGP